MRIKWMRLCAQLMLWMGITAMYAAEGYAQERMEAVQGGVIIIRNCPRNEIHNLKFVPSNAGSGGWAEIHQDDERVRIRFDGFTQEELERFNQVGQQTDPRIHVIVYHGDFLFFVRASIGASERPNDSQPISILPQARGLSAI